MNYEPKPGGPLTPEVLEYIADELDLTDRFVEAVSLLLESHNLPQGSVSGYHWALRERARGKEMQNDLRRWAAEMRGGDV